MSWLSQAEQIVTGLVSGKMTWTEAESEIDQTASKVFSSLPAAAQTAVTTAISDVKQGASNALAIAGSALAPDIAIGTKAVEGALDTLIVAYTGGLAVPLVAGVNDGLDALGGYLTSAIQARLLQQKAALAAAMTPAAAPKPSITLPGGN